MSCIYILYEYDIRCADSWQSCVVGFVGNPRFLAILRRRIRRKPSYV